MLPQVTPRPNKDQNESQDSDRLNEGGHLFAGYFLPYPGKQWRRKGDGYISTVSEEAPQLNWVYLDKDTFEVKYGLRAEAEDYLVGLWNCTPVDKRLTFDGWEGFTCVEVDRNVWQLFFDVEDNGLEGKVSAD